MLFLTNWLNYHQSSLLWAVAVGQKRHRPLARSTPLEEGREGGPETDKGWHFEKEEQTTTAC